MISTKDRFRLVTRYCPTLCLAVAFLVCVFLGISCTDSGGNSNSLSTSALLGGDTTVFNTSSNAFSFAAANLDGDRLDLFVLGNSFFKTNWTIAPASAEARDGLGPLFNANSCSSCHLRDGKGAPPDDENDTFGSLLLRLSIPGEDANGGPLGDPTYGGQFQQASNPGIDEEGTSRVFYTEVPGTYADGTPYSLREPAYQIDDLKYGALHPDVMISPRIGSQMIGLGLLASVAESDIQALADEFDSDGDGISGRPNLVYDIRSDALALGRFGWKAGQPTLEQQGAAAFLNDIGITNSLFPDEGCTSSELDCLAATSGGDPEIDQDKLDAVTFYLHLLAVPGRRNPTDPQIVEGQQLFSSAGCASCHTHTLQTTTNPDFPELSNQTFHPYTDLLLHDMGAGLADNRPEFEADGREWRTAPLWGSGLIMNVNGHTFYLHDGRARNLAEAILWHGGEAETAKEAFRNMSASEREALIAFLNDL